MFHSTKYKVKLDGCEIESELIHNSLFRTEFTGSKKGTQIKHAVKLDFIYAISVFIASGPIEFLLLNNIRNAIS